MIERLIEHWLDSVNERAYQPVFCQMLIARGYSVLHSTRHSPLEFGKDVVARDPSGDLCAFQLKGNPGGRLTKRAAAGMLDQVKELVHLPAWTSHTERHRAYLVTNGEIDEEARQLLAEVGRSIGATRAMASSFELLSRGDLLSQAVALESSLWPKSPVDLANLFRLLAVDGTGMLDLSSLDAMLRTLLVEDPGQKKAEFARAMASAALLVSIALRSYTLKENHFAILSSWLMTWSYSVSGACKRGFSLTGSVKESLSLYESAIRTNLENLVREAAESTGPLGESGFSASFTHGARATLVRSLVGTYLLWSARWPSEDWPLRDAAADWSRREFKPEVWGEACVPQVLAIVWQIGRFQPGLGSDRLLAALSRVVILGSRRRIKSGLPGPYYDFEEVSRHFSSRMLGPKQTALNYDFQGGSSFFTSSLFDLLVRRNLKQLCKLIWYDYTKVDFREYIPAEPWEYGLFRSAYGAETHEIHFRRGEWSSVVETASEDSGDHLPEAFRSHPILLLLLTIVFPHRANRKTVRFLDGEFGQCWFRGAGRG